MASKKEPYVPYHPSQVQYKACKRCCINLHITYFRLNNHLNVFDYSREDICYRCKPIIADELYFQERERHKKWLKTPDGVEFLRKKGRLNAREYLVARSIATPLWANLQKIKTVYERCRENLNLHKLCTM